LPDNISSGGFISKKVHEKPERVVQRITVKTAFLEFLNNIFASVNKARIENKWLKKAVIKRLFMKGIGKDLINANQKR